MNYNANCLFLLVVATICLATTTCCRAQESVQVSPLTIGQTIKFKSMVLNEERTLNVFLPGSYGQSAEKKYPVIYVLDGSMDEDFIHIAGLTQFGSFSWIEMMPESIVIGIGNVDRKRDFTAPPTDARDKTDFPTAGGSANFIKLLDAEIKPLVDKQYRTNGVETLIGQSFGGLLATEVLFKRPEMYENYIIISPSLWWNDGALLKAELPAYDQAASVFVGVGKEGEVMESLAKRLFDKVQQAKSEKLTTYFETFPECDHGDTLHLAAYKAFGAIFAKKKSAKE